MWEDSKLVNREINSVQTNCGVSVTELDVKVIAVVEEGVTCRGNENWLCPLTKLYKCQFVPLQSKACFAAGLSVQT